MGGGALYIGALLLFKYLKRAAAGNANSLQACGYTRATPPPWRLVVIKKLVHPLALSSLRGSLFPPISVSLHSPLLHRLGRFPKPHWSLVCVRTVATPATGGVSFERPLDGSTPPPSHNLLIRICRALRHHTDTHSPPPFEP